jgi:tRNA(Ile)-lysidine synthase
MFHAARLPGAPAAAESVEAWARRERYVALAALARAAGCDIVLLAHHRRDQAETVLLQLLRGGGARGLAAMPAEAERDGIRWLRPWRDQPREAIEAYLRRHRLRWVDDPGNADPRFARNRLQHAVWPALLAAFPQSEAALSGAAARAAEEAAALREFVAGDARACMDDDALRVAAWGALSPARRALLLRHQIEAWSGRGVPGTLVRRLMDELPRVPSGQWPAPGGTLRLRRGVLRYVHAPSGAGQHGG